MLKVTKILSADNSQWAFKVGANIVPSVVKNFECIGDDLFIFEYTFVAPEGCFWGKYEASSVKCPDCGGSPNKGDYFYPLCRDCQQDIEEDDFEFSNEYKKQ